MTDNNANFQGNPLLQATKRHLNNSEMVKGQVQGWGLFLIQFLLKFAENNDVGENVIWGL